jgi:hypothetical protein
MANSKIDTVSDDAALDMDSDEDEDILSGKMVDKYEEPKPFVVWEELKDVMSCHYTITYRAADVDDFDSGDDDELDDDENDKHINTYSGNSWLKTLVQWIVGNYARGLRRISRSKCGSKFSIRLDDFRHGNANMTVHFIFASSADANNQAQLRSLLKAVRHHIPKMFGVGC